MSKRLAADLEAWPANCNEAGSKLESSNDQAKSTDGLQNMHVPYPVTSMAS